VTKTGYAVVELGVSSSSIVMAFLLSLANSLAFLSFLGSPLSWGGVVESSHDGLHQLASHPNSWCSSWQGLEARCPKSYW